MLKGLDQRERELVGGAENNEEKLYKIEKMANDYKCRFQLYSCCYVVSTLQKTLPITNTYIFN